MADDTHPPREPQEGRDTMTDDTPPPNGRRTRRIRGYRKRLLLLALAHEDGTSADIGKRFDMNAGAVRQYKLAHKDEIAAIRADLENEFAGMWIAQKMARLAEYQEDVEQVNAMLEVPPPDPGDGDDDQTDGRASLVSLIRAKHNALKSAAEEMGHLPSRAGVVAEGKVVKVTIEGIDMSDLV